MDSEFLDWLKNDVSRNQTYHNHKETMAWVATALYFTGALAIGLNLDYFKAVLSAKIILTAVIAVFTVGTLLFVRWQFKNREIARLKVKYLIETVLEELSKTTFPVAWPNTFNKDWLLPSYVSNNILENEGAIKDVGGGTGSPRFISYSGVIVAAIALLLFIWLC